MSSSTSLIIAQIIPTRQHAAPAMLPHTTSRQCLLLLTATTAFKAMEMLLRAKDIPLFGLRQSLRKAEQEAEEIVNEGFEAVDKGIVTAEKGVEEPVSFSRLAQAGAVAGAEVVGAVIASSVVNGILGPEAQKS